MPVTGIRAIRLSSWLTKPIRLGGGGRVCRAAGRFFPSYDESGQRAADRSQRMSNLFFRRESRHAVAITITIGGNTMFVLVMIACMTLDDRTACQSFERDLTFKARRAAFGRLRWRRPLRGRRAKRVGQVHLGRRNGGDQQAAIHRGAERRLIDATMIIDGRLWACPMSQTVGWHRTANFWRDRHAPLLHHSTPVHHDHLVRERVGESKYCSTRTIAISP